MLTRRLTKQEFTKNYWRVLRLVDCGATLTQTELAAKSWAIWQGSRMCKRRGNAGYKVLWTLAHGFTGNMLNIVGRVGYDVEAAWRSFRVMQGKTIRNYQRLAGTAPKMDIMTLQEANEIKEATSNKPVLAMVLRLYNASDGLMFHKTTTFGIPAVSYPAAISDAKSVITAMLIGLEKVNQLAQARTM